MYLLYCLVLECSQCLRNVTASLPILVLCHRDAHTTKVQVKYPMCKVDPAQNTPLIVGGELHRKGEGRSLLCSIFHT